MNRLLVTAWTLVALMAACGFAALVLVPKPDAFIAVIPAWALASVHAWHLRKLKKDWYR